MDAQTWLAVSSIIMTGIILAIVAWQILAIGRSALEKKMDTRFSVDVEELRERVSALETELHAKSKS